MDDKLLQKIKASVVATPQPHSYGAGWNDALAHVLKLLDPKARVGHAPVGHRVVAMLDCSLPLDKGGDRWTSTKTFPAEARLAEVLGWAMNKDPVTAQYGGHVGNLRLQLDEGNKDG